MSENMVDIEIEMDDKVFLDLAKEAHERDITFNELVNEIIAEQILREAAADD